MALNFPNRSRSYDASGRRVCFWGHDGAFEISFFIDQRALSRMSLNPRLDEAGVLVAFDRYRDRILKAAAKAYSGQHKDAYTLLASDF